MRSDSADVQRMLADSVNAFTARASDMARVREWRGKAPGFDRELWQEMAELGWLGLLVPERSGGAALRLADMAVVAQHLGAQLLPEPLVPCAVLAARVLTACENKSLSAELLSGIASGESIVAVAFQEQAGDLDNPRRQTQVTLGGDGGVVLNGSKRFVAGASAADGFLVSADTDNGPVLLWLPTQTDGLALSLETLADGRFAGALSLSNVSLGDHHILARGNNASEALDRAVDAANAIVCAELLGLMGTALDMTLEYLRTRVQFGKAIGTFQVLQHRCVDLFVQQQLASASLSDALEALDNEPDARGTAATVSRAKARCADAAALITRQAIQMHGAVGFTEDSDVGLFVKRALTLSAWLGNSAYHRRRFARLAPDNEE